MKNTFFSRILNLFRRFGQQRIQARLTALILIITIPLLLGITTYISSRAGRTIEQNAVKDLQEHNESLSANVSIWLEFHVRTLREMAMLPDIISMSAVRQRPALQVIAASHPNLFLVQTTDLNGVNVARNDQSELKDYHDRDWFLGAKAGVPVTIEALISRTTGKPALNMASPIRNEMGEIVGVASIVSELDEISQEVLINEEGHSIIYIIDANNRVVAHPDPAFTSDELRDLSEYPPVVALRNGQTGAITFTDENGEVWRAYVSTLDNGWAIIAQQREDQLLAPVHQFQRVAILLIIIGSAAMLALAWFAIRRTLQPIRTLTETVSAIAAGDLNRVANVESQDEIGTLASTFNSMTSQLRELIGKLEQRVADRTEALATVSEISTAASTILDTNKLLQEVVDLSKERFELYHAHIYLLNETGDTLVLASGAGEAGRRMVAEGHFIPLDREISLVARAARERKGVTVNDVTQAPDFLPNSLLPNTRSEMAVPMILGEKVLGVFDVQSDQVERFTDSDIAIHTTLASQIASAVQNARLFTQAETARQDAQSLVDYAAEGIAILDLETELWAEPNENFARTFGMTREEMATTGPKIMSPPTQPDGRNSIEKAIEMINTAMEKGYHRFEWVHTTKQGTEFDCEIGLVRLPGARPRLRQSLLDITERKRLQQFTAQRAKQQEAINLITQKIQSADTVETALQVAARELGRALGHKATVVALDSAALAIEEKK